MDFYTGAARPPGRFREGVFLRRVHFETPKPISVSIDYGDGDMMAVMRDVLALTKVNYNACDYASGLPVTLKFADRVGDIPIASPNGAKAPPLPFRFYI